MDIVMERGTFFIISAPGCDAVTSFSRPLPQIGSSGCSGRAGGWPRLSRPSPRARPTFSLSGLGHTSCLAATSLSPNLHPPLSLSPSFFGTVSAAEPARIPWPQFQFQGHLSPPSSTSGARQAICDKFPLPQLLFETDFAAEYIPSGN